LILFGNFDFALQDHKYNCNFFVWVDEADALGRDVKTGRAVRAGPFSPINFRVWAL